jgi:hypothetical protein
LEKEIVPSKHLSEKDVELYREPMMSLGDLIATN